MNIDDDVRNCLCLNLRRAARRLTQAYDHALRTSGLKITQFQLLAAVQGFGRTTLIPLADFMGMDRTTLTRNLAVLDRNGLVRVEQGDEDRREQWVSLSDKGREAVARAFPAWRQVQRVSIEALGTAQAHGLLDELSNVGQVKL